MHFKIKGGKFQLCETINQNMQNGMNYLEIAVSVPGNDQAETDYLSVRKVKQHFSKTVFLDVSRCRKGRL